MSYIITCCKKYTEPQSSDPSFVDLKVEISTYESWRSGGAAPFQEKLREKYESRKDVVNQVNILYQLQVAGKMFLKFDPCANKLNCQWFHRFLSLRDNISCILD